MIEIPDDECDGCTCCRHFYCFPGVRILRETDDTTRKLRGDCPVGGEGMYREGESLCPCTEPMG